MALTRLAPSFSSTILTESRLKTHTSSSSTILTESRLKSLWVDKAFNVDEETTTCGWGDVCVCLCIRERWKRSKMNL